MKYLHQTQVITRLRRYKVLEPRIQKICWTICTHLGVADYDLAVQFVGVKAIQRLNKDFRSKDKPTDVLSFPQILWAKPKSVRTSAPALKKRAHTSKLSQDLLPREPLGDLVIALDVAAKNAQQIGQSLDREVCFLLVHGILHLCGHDHMRREDEKLMLTCQRRLMKILGDDSPKKALWQGCVQPAKRTSTEYGP